MVLILTRMKASHIVDGKWTKMPDGNLFKHMVSLVTQSMHGSMITYKIDQNLHTISTMLPKGNKPHQFIIEFEDKSQNFTKPQRLCKIPPKKKKKKKNHF